jgi:iron(III) transport system substrate-binding protein
MVGAMGQKKQVSELWLICLMTFLSFVVSVGSGHAAMTAKEAIESLAGLSRQERQNLLVREARKEGKIRWATSTPAESIEPIVQGFREKYPAVELEHFFVSGRVLADRVIREYRAGKREVDVLGTTTMTFLELKNARVIESYFSPEGGDIKPNMKDPNGFWVSQYTTALAVACNGKMVRAVPRDWKEFSDPQWKGNFSIDTERFQWFLGLRRIYGDEEAKKLILAYVHNGALVRRSGQLQIQLVAGGEYACALAVYLNDLINAVRKGAPLTYSAPEPILLSPTILMMTRFPPHPYGAILLYDYIISVEGVSQLTRNIPVLPSREGLPLADDIRGLQKRPSYFIQVEDQSRSFTETREMYQSLIKK